MASVYTVCITPPEHGAPVWCSIVFPNPTHLPSPVASSAVMIDGEHNTVRPDPGTANEAHADPAAAPSTPQATTGSHASTHRQHGAELAGDSLLSPTTRTIRPIPVRSMPSDAVQQAHHLLLSFSPFDPTSPSRSALPAADVASVRPMKPVRQRAGVRPQQQALHPSASRQRLHQHLLHAIDGGSMPTPPSSHEPAAVIQMG
ncbi:hypothetical protein ACLOJK_018709 [Asimina triloba]